MTYYIDQQTHDPITNIFLSRPQGVCVEGSALSLLDFVRDSMSDIKFSVVPLFNWPSMDCFSWFWQVFKLVIL